MKIKKWIKRSLVLPIVFSPIVGVIACSKNEASTPKEKEEEPKDKQIEQLSLLQKANTNGAINMEVQDLKKLIRVLKGEEKTDDVILSVMADQTKDLLSTFSSDSLFSIMRVLKMLSSKGMMNLDQQDASLLTSYTSVIQGQEKGTFTTIVDLMGSLRNGLTNAEGRQKIQDIINNMDLAKPIKDIILTLLFEGFNIPDLDRSENPDAKKNGNAFAQYLMDKQLKSLFDSFDLSSQGFGGSIIRGLISNLVRPVRNEDNYSSKDILGNPGVDFGFQLVSYNLYKYFYGLDFFFPDDIKLINIDAQLTLDTLLKVRQEVPEYADSFSGLIEEAFGKDANDFSKAVSGKTLLEKQLKDLEDKIKDMSNDDQDYAETVAKRDLIAGRVNNWEEYKEERKQEILAKADLFKVIIQKAHAYKAQYEEHVERNKQDKFSFLDVPFFNNQGLFSIAEGPDQEQQFKNSLRYIKNILINSTVTLGKIFGLWFMSGFDKNVPDVSGIINNPIYHSVLMLDMDKIAGPLYKLIYKGTSKIAPEELGTIMKVVMDDFLPLFLPGVKIKDIDINLLSDVLLNGFGNKDITAIKSLFANLLNIFNIEGLNDSYKGILLNMLFGSENYK